LFKKIAVAVDGSSFSDHAIDCAANLAIKYDGKVTLIHAIINPVFAYEGVILSDLDDKIEESGKEILKNSIERESIRNLRPEYRLVKGHPTSEIAKIVNDESYDLLVIGSRGQGSVKAFLLGSVSEKISRFAKCPVLIVKPKV
jgi:nucleotide-binding universal stress UspA family protein